MNWSPCDRLANYSTRLWLFQQRNDVVIIVDDAEWSASGDAGDSTDEDVPVAVSDWLWGRGWPSYDYTWQIHPFWVSSLHSAGISELVLAQDADWMATVVYSSLGQTSAEKADWMWVCKTVYYVIFFHWCYE